MGQLDTITISIQLLNECFGHLVATTKDNKLTVKHVCNEVDYKWPT